MNQDSGSQPQAKPQLGFPIVLILGGLIVLLASLGVFSDAWGWIWPILILLLGAGWLVWQLLRPPINLPRLFFPALMIIFGFAYLLRRAGLFPFSWDWLWPALCILLGSVLLVLRWRKAR